MGPRKNDMEENSHVLDGDFGCVQNGAAYADLQILFYDQLDITTGRNYLPHSLEI